MFIKATIGNMADLLEVAMRVWHVPMEELEQILTRRVQDAETLVGYCWDTSEATSIILAHVRHDYTHNFNSEPVVEIERLSVLEGYWGDIPVLLGEVHDWAKKQHIHKVVLSLSTQQDSITGDLEACGMKKVDYVYQYEQEVK